MSNLTRCRTADREPFKAIQSPIVSDEGVHLAVLTITAIIATTSAETAIEEVLNSQMACAPNDPTDRFQPALAIGATATNESGLYGLVERLDGFMKLANLAAEVCGHCLIILRDDRVGITPAADVDSSMGQARLGSGLSGVYRECSRLTHYGY